MRTDRISGSSRCRAMPLRQDQVLIPQEYAAHRSRGASTANPALSSRWTGSATVRSPAPHACLQKLEERPLYSLCRCPQYRRATLAPDRSRGSTTWTGFWWSTWRCRSCRTRRFVRVADGRALGSRPQTEHRERLPDTKIIEMKVKITPGCCVISGREDNTLDYVGQTEWTAVTPLRNCNSS